MVTASLRRVHSICELRKGANSTRVCAFLHPYVSSRQSGDLIKAKLIGVLEGDHCVGLDAKASRMIEMDMPAARWTCH